MSKSLGELFSSGANNFNLIRLLAALSVIYGHAGVVTGGHEVDFFLRFVGYKFIGGVAVDVFFVLSGFLIASSAESGKGISYYLASRVLRIYPGLIVCVCSCILVLGLFYARGFDFFSWTTWRYFWVNASAVNTEYFLPGVFDGRPDRAVNGSLWSVPVEVRMYLAILALHVVGIVKNRTVFNALFFFGALLAYFSPESFHPYLLSDSHLHVVGMFAIGTFCWVNRNSIYISAPVLFALLVMAGAVHRTPNFAYAYVLLLPYALWCLAFAPGFLWFNRIGDYSYGVYLYGWPAQQAIASSFPSMTTLHNTIWSMIAATLLGLASWTLVEKPSLRLKRYFSKARGALK